MSAGSVEWLALRRVHEGSITKLGGHYFRGVQFAGYLADALDELIGRGLLALGRPDPAGRQQACVTHTGQRRYAALRSGRGDQQAGDGGR